MNIFYLSNNPVTCAQYHVDKHVVKMILEYSQLLSTAHRVLDGKEQITLSKTGRKQKVWSLNDSRDSELYKATHINHPSAKWVRDCVDNYKWLYSLFCSTCDEYTHRYNKKHLTDIKLRDILKQIPKNINHVKPFSEPWRAMPDDVKIGNDVLASYRNYYIKKKVTFAKWTKRDVPDWFTEGLNANL